jgi:hypothetical protein
MRRGISPVVAQSVVVAVLSIVAMLVSMALLFVVHMNGGLVQLLARAMVAQCLATRHCDQNNLMLQTAAPIIIAAQVAIMLAKMASVNASISDRVQTELEDADLLAAVQEAAREEQPCKEH